MAGETLSFEILARDNASRTFRSVGDEALKTSAKVDAAAASMKLFDDTVQKQGKAAATSEAALRSHQKAAALLADTENVLGGRATTTTKLMADQRRELDKGAGSVSRYAREAENAAGASEGLGTSLAGAANPMGALVGAGVALAPVVLTLGFGLGGLAVAAAGVVSPILKAAQASGGLQANLSKLDPIQRQAATGLLVLQKEYQGFQASLKPVIFSDFNAGLHLAAGLMHDVQPVARATGVALGSLLGRIDAEFQSGTWQSFFGFMERTAGPDIKLLGDSFVNLLHSLPTLAMDLQPVATTLLQVTDAATKAIGPVAHFIAIGEQAKFGGGSWGELTKIWDSFSAHVPHAALLQPWLDSLDKTGPAAKSAGHGLNILGTDAQSADAKVLSLNTGLEALLGQLVGSSTAVDSTDAAWQSLGKALKTSSLGSLAGRQAYDSYLSAVASGLSTLEKNHASFHQLNGYLATNIARLRSLGPLNATQRQELDALIKRQDQLAQSTQTLTGRQRAMLTQIEAGFLPDLRKMNVLTPQVRADVDRFGVAITNTGTSSKATRGARQQLITDLENAGVKASVARQFVRNLQGAISALHGKNVNVGLTTSGSGKIIITGTGIATHVINTSTGQVSASGGHTVAPGGAAGMLVRGGVPGRDSVLVNTMPGELIVPTKMVQAGAVDHLRGKIPGFAAGGLVGGAVRAENAIGLADVQVGSSAAVDLAKAAAAAARAAAAAAAAAAGAARGPATGGPAAAQAYARSRLAAYGWGPGQMPPLIALWNQESGWNRFARNPSSGAYGIPQALPPSKMGAAANPPTSSMAAQVNWGLGYIRGRYGSPAAAEAHELAYRWYDQGGYLPTGLSLAYNGTGRPEPVIPAGRGGAGVTVNVTVNVPPTVNPRQAGQEIAEVLKAHLRGGGSLYPAGMTPR